MFNEKSLYLLLMLCILLTGCTSALKDGDTKIPLESEDHETLIEKELDNKDESMITAENKEMIKAELKSAIIEIRQPSIMEVSAIAFSEMPELDIKNLYYEILSESPKLKYAYDVSAILEDSLLTCQISYMPYKTGDFPEGFEGTAISSLKALVDIAQANLGSESMKIRIMNQSFDPELLNIAFQQAGNGYIICALNQDATEITYQTPIGFTMEESLSAINEANQIADDIIFEYINENMTVKEKAEALYSYISKNVKYDGRYNTDRENMPYESQTALGALKYGTAICGGYAHAVKLLFEKVGIPCLNVTGSWFGANHMWNIAQIDGEWLWYDATADRGNSSEYGLYHFGLNELDAFQYVWDDDLIKQLLYE